MAESLRKRILCAAKAAEMVKLLFINRDARSASFSSSIDDKERTLINTHVQRVRKQVRRRQRPVKAASTRPTFLPFRRKDDVEVAAGGTASPTDFSKRCKEQVPQCQPLTILQKGNSDPFESSAVRVTPEIAEIMCFFKDYYLPTSYGTDAKAWFRPYGAHKQWCDTVALLNSRSCGPAFLLTQATLMANLSQSRSRKAELLSLKGDSFKALRSSIAAQGDGDINVINGVVFLFAAEVFAGNVVEAILHGKTLQRLLVHEAKHNAAFPIYHGLVSRALWYDVHLAQAYMIRTIFDVDRWAMEILEPSFKSTNNYFANLREDFTAGMDVAIAKEPLRSIFCRTRQIAWLFQLNLTGDDGGYSVSFWMLANSYISQGRLLNYHIDIQQRLQRKVEDNPASELFWQTQSCIALGLLLWVAYFGGDRCISGKPLLPIVSTLSSHLQVALSSALQASTAIDDLRPSESSEHQALNALLWAAYEGMQHERAKSTPTDSPIMSWFGQTFTNLVQRLGLQSWPMVSERLRRFLYVDDIEPHDFNFESIHTSVLRAMEARKRLPRRDWWQAFPVPLCTDL